MGKASVGKRFGWISYVLAVTVVALSLNPLRRFPGDGQGELGSYGVELISLEDAIGPESLAFDADGRGPFTGVSDGRILQWDGPEKRWRQFAVSAPNVERGACGGSKHKSTEHVCGRPLGLQFHHKSGDLYFADAYLGLLAVGGDGGATRVVATAAEGLPFGFTNAIEIDQETGIVYFTDSSTHFSRRDFVVALLCGDATGRLMSYDPSTGELKVLAEGLSFANGIALSEDKSFIAVVETLHCRVLRYWLKTDKAGQIEILANLPGFPDNISRSPRGGFWVAMYAPRSKVLKMIVPLPWLGRLLKWASLDLEKVVSLLLRWRAVAMAWRVGENGELLETLRGDKRWGLRYLSEVVERNGTLWMGSVVMPHFGVVRGAI
ncbi:protein STRICTOSIDINE SYNTHASE-LIKE 10-like [Wolffia australiana]